MRSPFLSVAATCVISALATFGAAKAQDRIGLIMEMAQACKADYQRFCPDTPPGGGRIVDCLRGHKDDLSAKCFTAFAVGAAIRACEPDYRALCSGVQLGSQRVLQCLSDNGQNVSTACRDALTRAIAPGFTEQRRNDNPNVAK